MNAKKIGVLGSGNVGQTLGSGFLSLGCEVKIGSRDPGKLAAWKSSAKGQASVGTFAETATWAEIVVSLIWWQLEQSWELWLSITRNFPNALLWASWQVVHCIS